MGNKSIGTAFPWRKYTKVEYIVHPGQGPKWRGFALMPTAHDSVRCGGRP